MEALKTYKIIQGSKAQDLEIFRAYLSGRGISALGTWRFALGVSKAQKF
jgi:hypothetical protein